MNIKDFVKDVLVELDQAVLEAGNETARDVWLQSGSAGHHTVEFDMAVAVEESKGTKGKAGVRVLELIEGGGELSSTSTNSTVSRIRFGVDFASSTKKEQERSRQIVAEHNDKSSQWPAVF